MVRNFETIGEAANLILKDFHESNPQVNWSGMVAFRNVLIHKYFGLDHELI